MHLVISFTIAWLQTVRAVISISRNMYSQFDRTVHSNCHIHCPAEVHPL